MTQKKLEDQTNELSEEQLDEVSAGTPAAKTTTKPTTSKPTTSGVFEVSDWSFDIEQTLN
jgi:hypothetical protein